MARAAKKTKKATKKTAVRKTTMKEAMAKKTTADETTKSAAKRTKVAREPRGSPARDAKAAGRAPDTGELRARLARALPEPRCELEHASAWQLLVATILSAQSTDARVNLVTPALFARYPTPAALGAAPQEAVEELVKSTGFFRNKARAIREASREVAERFGGEVPRDMEAAMSLRGVARKTANLVLGTAYGLATGIIVDTHAARVAQRLALTRESEPTKIERDLCALFPRDEWVATGHRLVLHGRYVCSARAPRCAECPLNELCPAREHAPLGSASERARAEALRVATKGASAD